MEDPRKTGLKNGLRQLSLDKLLKLRNYEGEMVVDEFNYYKGCFCPLAIAEGLETMENPTHDKVRAELVSRGYVIDNTRGISGEFFSNQRRLDLIQAIEEVLEEKALPAAL